MNLISIIMQCDLFLTVLKRSRLDKTYLII